MEMLPFQKRRPRALFSPEEDKILRRLVEEIGEDQWNQVSDRMEDRTPRQCRERWQKYLAPSLILNEWTEDEDRMLDDLVKSQGPKWKHLALLFPNRTDVGLKNRWRMHERAARRKMLMKKATKKMSAIYTIYLNPSQTVNEPKIYVQPEPPLEPEFEWLDWERDDLWGKEDIFIF
jgi:hypothetical protein